MAQPRQKTSGHSPVVIVGGGIIGFATAYYLSLDGRSARSISIVDNASTLFAGASGKANGILGDYGFVSQAKSLGKLSWDLHQKLTSENGGRAGWGYREAKILNLHASSSSAASTARLGSSDPSSPLPAWCIGLQRYASTSLSDLEKAARINPMDFCKFLQGRCEAMGVRVLLDATVSDVRVEHGSLDSVTITQNNKTTILECHNLVIAAGPWSERVLRGLFPNSRVHIPSCKQPDSGNYIVLKAPGGNRTQDTRVCHQIYLEGLGHKVDVSSRPNGTLYIGGSVSARESLPETTTDVQYQWESGRKMYRLVAEVFDWFPKEVELVELLETGRAYRPCLEHGRPIVSKVPLDELLDVTHRGPIEARNIERGGVYLNVGHGRDGITLGPGSGKVMSELIEGGKSMSADISGLGIL